MYFLTLLAKNDIEQSLQRRIITRMFTDLEALLGIIIRVSSISDVWPIIDTLANKEGYESHEKWTLDLSIEIQSC